MHDLGSTVLQPPNTLEDRGEGTRSIRPPPRYGGSVPRDRFTLDRRTVVSFIVKEWIGRPTALMVASLP